MAILAVATVSLAVSGYLLADAPSAELACPSCDDFNGCTEDRCDTAFGTCQHLPRSCDDHDPCTIDQCDFSEPEGCIHTFRAAGSPCDDLDSCTQNDACGEDHQCRGAARPAETTCDDGNPCTLSDTCSESAQCAGTPQEPGSPCDDSNLCTTGDICAAGTPGGAPICQGSPRGCADGNPCTVDSCSPATGECSFTSLSCDDGNLCTGDSCDLATGTCLRSFVAGTCQDGNFCTDDDVCSGGNCQPGGPRSCDDSTPCSIDTCDPLHGCRHLFDHAQCDDHNVCTSDRCLPSPIFGCLHDPVGGLCGGQDDPCFDRLCSDGFCSETIVYPGPCDDHNACTGNGTCTQFGCIGGALLNCSDGNDCTSDTCDTLTGCDHGALSGPVTCGRGACQRTIDCQAGAQQICVPGQPSPEACNGADDDCDSFTDEGSAICSDNNSCTTDQCGGSGGCSHGIVPDGTACSIVSCPIGGTCQSGVCQGSLPTEVCNGADDDCDGLVDEGGGAALCGDNNSCTTDVCGGFGGCSHAVLPDGAPCSDAGCPTGSTCRSGACRAASFSFDVGLAPNRLFPPDHRLVEVHADFLAHAPCAGPLTYQLVSVTSSEPDDAPGTGDGSTLNDIQGVQAGTADFSFMLRAERDASIQGPGRVYTVTYRAISPTGDSQTASATVLVPTSSLRGRSLSTKTSETEPGGGRNPHSKPERNP